MDSTTFAMDRERILSTLRSHRSQLRDMGVSHAALFGSTARGEAGPHSDIDVLIELDPAAPITVFDYADIVAAVRSLFDRTVDVANRDALRPHIRQRIERDAVYAF